MRVLMNGGVFNLSKDIQEARKSTIEIMLANELERRGHTVTTIGNEDKASLNILRDGTYDVVHMNHMNRGTLLLALQDTVPTVYTSHDPFIASGIPMPNEKKVWTLGRQAVFRYSDVVVALSNIERSRISERFRIPQSRICVVHNGLDVESYVPPKCGSSIPRKYKLRVLFVGQMVLFKGIDILIKALRLVVGQGVDAELLIVSQNMSLREQILAQASALGLGERVVIIGPLTREELVNEYYSCDVYVHASRGEGLSTSTMEAMACAKPVVATDVGGTRDLLGDRGNVLVKSEDVDGLAQGIIHFSSSSSELLREIGRRNQAAVRDYFTVTKMTDLYERVYKYAQEHRVKRTVGAASSLRIAQTYFTFS